MSQKIVFVCTGNTCRSPLAEVILKKMAQEGSLDVEVQSAGLMVFASLPASDNSRQVAQEKGLDLSEHRSQPLSKDLALNSDLIITMTSKHRDAIAHKMTALVDKVKMLSEIAGEGERDVEDPVGGDIDHYREAWDQIEDYLKKSVGTFRRKDPKE